MPTSCVKTDSLGQMYSEWVNCVGEFRELNFEDVFKGKLMLKCTSRYTLQALTTAGEATFEQ